MNCQQYPVPYFFLQQQALPQYYWMPVYQPMHSLQPMTAQEQPPITVAAPLPLDSSTSQIGEQFHLEDNLKQVPKKTPHSNKVQFQTESKNIQKNYAKAITSYLSKNKYLVSKVLDKDSEEFMILMKKVKNQLQNVCHLSDHTENPDFLRAFRILANYFLKNKSTSYIFNSRIQKKTSHLKNKNLIQHSLLRC